MPKVIDHFRAAYWPLSNFSLSWVIHAGHRFPTVENAFQAAKHASPDPDWYEDMANVSATVAKRKGRSCPLREDWKEAKESIMLGLLYQKFTRSGFARDVLLGTGNAELIEGNDWGDREWGVVDGEGENKLGKMLMQVRADLLVARRKEQ